MLVGLIFILCFFQLSSGCLSTANPMPDTTTTVPITTTTSTTTTTTTTTTICNCRNPVNNAGATCGTQPVNLPTFTNNGQCQLEWSGCVNYRYVLNGMCVMGPQAQNPATTQGFFTCPAMNQFPVNGNGVTFEAVDCGP